jgi:hypothetical protein
MSVAACVDKISVMFTVDEPTAEAIRRAVDEGGELAGVVELRRHFPLLAQADHAHARLCVRMIAGWKSRPLPPEPPANTTAGKKARPRRNPEAGPNEG